MASDIFQSTRVPRGREKEARETREPPTCSAQALLYGKEEPKPAAKPSGAAVQGGAAVVQEGGVSAENLGYLYAWGEFGMCAAATPAMAPPRCQIVVSQFRQLVP